MASLFGADPNQFRVLLNASITLDLRRERSGHRRRGNAMLWMLTTYFVVGAVMGLGMFPRFPAATYAFVMINLAMLNSALAVLVDFHTAILNPDDSDVVGFRPVSGRTYLLARLANFVFYVAIVSLALNAAPAVMGTWCARSNIAFAPLYLAASTLACLFVSSLVVVVYALLVRIFNVQRVKDLLVWAQLVILIVVTMSYQFMNTLATLQFDFESHVGWKFVPQLWFVTLATLSLEPVTTTRLLLASVGVVGALALLAAPVSVMSVRYAEYLSALAIQRRSARPAVGGRRTSWLERLVPGSQRPIFNLCLATFARDRQIKMRTVTAIFLPFAYMIYGAVAGSLTDPLAARKPWDLSLSFVLPVFVTLGVTSSLFAMQTGDSCKAAWLYYAAPIPGFSVVVRSVLTFIRVCVIVPIVAVFAVVCAVVWRNPAHALIHTGLSGLMIDLFASIAALLLVRDYPFSRPVTRGDGTRFLLIYFPMIAVSFGVSLLFMAAYALPYGVETISIVLLTQVVAARFLVWAVSDARGVREQEFAE